MLRACKRTHVSACGCYNALQGKQLIHRVGRLPHLVFVVIEWIWVRPTCDVDNVLLGQRKIPCILALRVLLDPRPEVLRRTACQALLSRVLRLRRVSTGRT
jgi:hypothetical protein